MSRPAVQSASRPAQSKVTSYTAGTERRTFIVLCHINGGSERRLIRHVMASSVEDIADALHAEFRRPCTGSILYFNNASMAYLPLTSRDWDKLPKCLELQVEFSEDNIRDWTQQGAETAGQKSSQPQAWKQFTTGDGSRSSSATISPTAGAGPAAAAQMHRFGDDTGATGSLADDDSSHESIPLKAKIVKHLRNLLLPLFNDGQISREEIIVICSAVTYDYAASLVDSVENVDDVMSAVSQTPLSSELKRALALLLEKYVAETIGPFATEAGERQSEGGGTTTNSNNRVVAIDKKKLERAKENLLHEAVPESEKSKRTKLYESKDGALKGYYASLAQNNHLGGNGHESFGGSPVTSSRGGPQKFRNDRQEYYDDPFQQQTRTPNSASRRPWSSRASADSRDVRSQQQQQDPLPSIFNAVHYTVAGRFPTSSGGNSSGGGLEVSLTSPNLISSDHDVVIIGRIQSKSPVTLTWWLAYGPNRHVLNMDDLYLHRCVSTYQVSPNGFILTIRNGSLVAGWDYYVYLSVSSDLLGTQSSAQASFHLPSQFRKLTALEAYATQQHNQTSAMNAFTSGYYGDEEFGALSPDQQQQQRAEAPGIPAAIGAPPGTDGSVTAASPPPASSAWRHRQSPQPQVQKTYLGMTFQEQLRAFFIEQIEPLYFLCENPNLTNAEFKSIVKDVARKFWFSKPADANLDDSVRRDIILLVKTAVTKRRMDSDQAQLSSTDIPPLSLRPQFASVLRR